MYIKYLLFICLLITSTPVWGQIQLQNQKVSTISIEMQNVGGSYDNKGLLSRLKTKEGNLFVQEDFDLDLKMLSMEFDRIEPSFEMQDDSLRITLKIWPKPVIRTIQWEGNETLKTSALQKELAIYPGTVFERSEFNKAFHKLKAYYIKKGFFEAELNYKAVNNVEDNTVNINVSIKEGRSGRIEQIIFKGFTDDEESEVIDLIMTKQYNIFLSWYTEQGTYREDMMQQDELTIIDYLQNHGYADARVDIGVKEAENKSRIIIEITTEKGEIYSFGEVTFEGNTLYSDKEIRQHIRIRPGFLFSINRLREITQEISRLYGAKGYIDAYVTFEPSLDPEKPIYHVHFCIDEGAQFRVGMINVIGNTCTQTSVILHETLLIPGEVFNEKKLRYTEERLRNIGYFKNVNVYAVKSDEQCAFGPTYRDVIIEVEETGTGDFSAFMGFSTEENLFGGISITEKNFNYRGITSIFEEGFGALRGGGEYAHITGTLGQKTSSFVFSWAKPFFMDTNWIIGSDFELSSNHVISRNYHIDSKGIRFHAKYPINQFLKFGWHYRLRNAHTSLDGETSDPSLIEEARNSGIVSATGIAFNYDSTDHLIKPSKGFRSKFEFEFAGLGGNNRFFSLGYINTWYKRVRDCGVLRYRANFCYVIPIMGSTLETLPLDERLFLGGETSVRGYRPFALGPQFEPGSPKGGLSEMLISLEYDHEIFSAVDAFIFFDAGSISEEIFNINTIRSSWGYGLRLRVIPGGPPVVVGMGYPTNYEDRSQVKKFFLSIGTQF